LRRKGTGAEAMTSILTLRYRRSDGTWVELEVEPTGIVSAWHDGAWQWSAQHKDKHAALEAAHTFWEADHA